jgi:16S rRNA (uracil1498-N3)-methyltransferase
MKHTFFASPDDITEGTIQFSDEEAHHAVRVLRVKTGDEASVVDGKGNWYETTLTVVGRRSMVGSIRNHRLGVGEPVYDLTLGVGMLKNTARFETFLEKAVELGVRRVVPLITRRSEKLRLKGKRIDAIRISAMKQSGRSRLLEIDEPVKLKKWMKDLPKDGPAFRAVCHEGAPTDQGLQSALQAASASEPLQILVGPEGGFSEEELGTAVGAGFRIVSLAPRRLRTETAAIVCASAAMLRFMRNP